MSKSRTYFFLFALTFGMLTSAAQAQEAEAPAEEEPAFTVDLGVDFFSDYMFRGQNFYPGPSIQPSIAPNLSLGDYGNLSGLTWFHFSADGTQEDVEPFFEFDQSVTYDITFGPATISVGHVWYTFPDESDDIPTTAEFFTSLSLDTVLTPTFSLFRDYRETDTQYYELGFSQKFDFEDRGISSVTPFVSIGFASNAEKVYGQDDGYIQTTYGVSAEFPVGPCIIQPHLAYTDGEAKQTVDEFWTGVSLIYSF